jgi:hypothetical protein
MSILEIRRKKNISNISKKRLKINKIDKNSNFMTSDKILKIFKSI